jgi:hypothetical protein
MKDKMWSRGTALALPLTSALDVGGWLTARLGHFTPGKETWYPLDRRVGEPSVVRDGCENPPPPGFDSRSNQPVASHYTN